jgi:adenylosuccinate synthase
MKKETNKITPIIGLQWGDEGKGKGVARLASYLSENDLVVRFQGGNNAGHTIYHHGQRYVFSLIPSGLFGKMRIHLGAGMVINPAALKKEMAAIPKNISFIKRLSVSPHAVLVLPTHLLLDSVGELKKGKNKIGSTGKGIAPAYTELVSRGALRVGDIFQKDFKQRYNTLTKEHQKILFTRYQYKIDPSQFKELEKNFWEGIKLLSTLSIKNSAELVEKTLADGNKVVAEGAQGTLLDIRFGNYPFVTSSHTIASGVGTGLGVPPSKIGGAIGILKAYTTKVGEGPFPTELGGVKSAVWCRDKKFNDEKNKFPNPDPNSQDEFEQGVALRRLGNEIGAVTGRLRRTGLLDIPLVKFAININNATELVLTKLDILDGFKKIKVCTHYLINGEKTQEVPFDLSCAKIKCVYRSFPVWKGKLFDYGNKLPKEAIGYIKFLEKTFDAHIIYVGTGPEDHQVVERYW